ncbi:MAG: hypothetical protein IGQ88_13605 [Gloeomargaritaceae cyanobacterium C42_A2020_066]|nr:hypothetical protein [Gloeomargaritaceae cyanobacterium C42_A2020_066]
MDTLKIWKTPITTCRHCRYYIPEGRRGGLCEQLNAPVQGCWQACGLGAAPFAPSWEAQESFEDRLAYRMELGLRSDLEFHRVRPALGVASPSL